jgi:DNA ligase-1
METILEKGGEGLILRDPTAMYSPGRRSPLLASMLKVKPFLDDEAVVLDITLKDGRRGSVTVQDREGRIFKIAAGFRDIKSELPPVEGSVISFAFTSRNPDSGIPRFPRYIRVRSDSEFSH